MQKNNMNEHEVEKQRKKRSLIIGLVLAGLAFAWYLATMYMVLSK